MIYLGLINNEPGAVADTFRVASWIARLAGSCAGLRCSYFDWRRKKRRDYDHAMEQRSVKEFHEVGSLLCWRASVELAIGP